MPSVHEFLHARGVPSRSAADRRCRSSIPSGPRSSTSGPFDARDLGTYLSMEHTRAALSRLTPRAGDILVDNWREPMLAFEADTRPAFTIR